YSCSVTRGLTTAEWYHCETATAVEATTAVAANATAITTARLRRREGRREARRGSDGQRGAPGKELGLFESWHRRDGIRAAQALQCRVSSHVVSISICVLGEGCRASRSSISARTRRRVRSSRTRRLSG